MADPRLNWRAFTVSAPNVSSLLAQSGESFNDAIGAAQGILEKYQAGQIQKTDAEVLQELAGLQNQEQFDQWLQKGGLAGRTVSDDVLKSLEGTRSGILDNLNTQSTITDRDTRTGLAVNKDVRDQSYLGIAQNQDSRAAASHASSMLDATNRRARDAELRELTPFVNRAMAIGREKGWEHPDFLAAQNQLSAMAGSMQYVTPSDLQGLYNPTEQSGVLGQQRQDAAFQEQFGEMTAATVNALAGSVDINNDVELAKVATAYIENTYGSNLTESEKRRMVNEVSTRMKQGPAAAQTFTKAAEDAETASTLARYNQEAKTAQESTIRGLLINRGEMFEESGDPAQVLVNRLNIKAGEGQTPRDFKLDRLRRYIDELQQKFNAPPGVIAAALEQAYVEDPGGNWFDFTRNTIGNRFEKSRVGEILAAYADQTQISLYNEMKRTQTRVNKELEQLQSQIQSTLDRMTKMTPGSLEYRQAEAKVQALRDDMNLKAAQEAGRARKER